MKKTKIISFLVPLFIVSASLIGVNGRAAYADSGVRGEPDVRGSSDIGSGSVDLVVRQVSRDAVTRHGSRGGYVGSRGGYVGSRGGYLGGRGGYIAPRYGGHVGSRHSSHFHGSIWIGPGLGFWDPFYYPYYSYPSYRYYSPPTTVVVPQQPQEFIMQEPRQEETGFWYYCKNPEGYYPYVERCPSGWMKVLPDITPPD